MLTVEVEVSTALGLAALAGAGTAAAEDVETPAPVGRPPVARRAAATVVVGAGDPSTPFSMLLPGAGPAAAAAPSRELELPLALFRRDDSAEATAAVLPEPRLYCVYCFMSFWSCCTPS